jgi:hypothetical protein
VYRAFYRTAEPVEGRTIYPNKMTKGYLTFPSTTSLSIVVTTFCTPRGLTLFGVIDKAPGKGVDSSSDTIIGNILQPIQLL